MTIDLEPVATAAALRALPPPSVPPPGPLDAIVGLLLCRAAPFDFATQSALRTQQGWGTEAPAAIGQVRSRGRWLATPALRRLTAATAAPEVLTEALDILAAAAPCTSGEAALALHEAGLTSDPMHPGGVLSLASWYGIESPLRLVARHGGTSVVRPRDAEIAAELHRIRVSLGRRGHLNLAEREGGYSEGQRRMLVHDVDKDPRVRRRGDLLLRVDDRASGLCRQVVRMLWWSPRALTVEELTGGLQRHWRFRPVHIPNASTLTEWVAAQPWLSVQDDGIVVSGELTPGQVAMTGTAGTEQLASVTGAVGAVTWAQLVAALTEAGFVYDTAKIAVMTSPVLVPDGHNRYLLRGSSRLVSG